MAVTDEDILKAFGLNADHSDEEWKEAIAKAELAKLEMNFKKKYNRELSPEAKIIEHIKMHWWDQGITNHKAALIMDWLQITYKITKTQAKYYERSIRPKWARKGI